MRFITEFELEPPRNYDMVLLRCKESGKRDLADLIEKSFGWEERGVTTLHGPVKEKYTLEIEAFPIKDYLDFKVNLINYLVDKGINPKVIQDRFSILESIGKPSGDTITNLPDLEYRGSSSHCKACEDEKAGIKHIQAQRHTCGK